MAACAFCGLPLPAPGIEGAEVVAGVFGGLPLPFLGRVGTSVGTGVFLGLPLPFLGELGTLLGVGVAGVFRGLPLPLLGWEMTEASGRVTGDGCEPLENCGSFVSNSSECQALTSSLSFISGASLVLSARSG